MAKITIVALRSKKSADGTVPLFIAIRHENERAYVSLGVSVRERDWNASAREVRKTHPEPAKINRFLRGEVSRAESVILDLQTSGYPFTAKEVKRRLMPGYAPRMDRRDFLKYADEILEAYRARGQISTWKAYRTARTKLAAFNKARRGEEALPFEEITPAFMRAFHSYLIEVERNRANTVHKNMSSIKTMLRLARDEGLTPPGFRPFATIKLKKEQAIKQKLSTDDVRKIAAFQLPEGSVMQLMRDAWLFAFFAGGMRFSDVATMKGRHLVESNGQIRSLYRMGKTKNVHGVLLVEQAVEILKRWGYPKKPNEYVFPILEGYPVSTPEELHSSVSKRNALANKFLKKIGRRAGVATPVTFHLSRHSLAGYLLEQGHDVYTIKEVLAHETVRITEEYLRGFNSQGPDAAMQSIKL